MRHVFRSSRRALGIACIAIVAVARTGRPATCDPDVVRAAAEASCPGYGATVARADGGVLTVRFARPEGDGAFAVALHAAGTRLTTSFAATGIDEAERSRVAGTIARWWERTDLQEALAACTGGSAVPAEATLAAAARRTLGAEPDDVGTRAFAVTLLFGAAWIALAALLAAAVADRARAPAERAAVVALFAWALVLDRLLCVGGPGDLRLNLAAVFRTNDPALYWGPAPVELFRLLGLLLDRSVRDVDIAAVNLVLAGAVPVLVWAIVAELGIAHRAALIAAFVTAAHPLLIAFSADLGRQSTLLFAAFGSILGLARFLRRGGAAALLAFVLGTVLAVTSRPEGVQTILVDAAVLAFAAATRARRTGAGLVLALLAAGAGVYLRTLVEYGRSWVPGSHPVWTDPRALLATVVLSPDFTPLAWIVVWIGGVLAALRRRTAWIGVATVLALHVAWSATGVYGSFLGYTRQVASARYEAVLLLPFAIGTALLAERMLAADRRIRLGVAATLGVLTALTYPRAYDTLLRPFTIDYEYRFLRRWALALPSASRVYVLAPPVNDLGFVDADLVGLFVHSGVDFEPWDPRRGGPAPSPSDTYLYVGSSCAAVGDQPNRPLGDAYPQWLRDCASMRSRVARDAVEEIDVPARKTSWYDFVEPTVRLGLYRLPQAAAAR